MAKTITARKRTLSSKHQYIELQSKFPGKPFFQNDLCSQATEIICHATQTSKGKAVRSVLSPLDNVFKAKFGEDFSISLTKCCPKVFQAKCLPNEVRNKKRKMSLAILSENQSWQHTKGNV